MGYSARIDKHSCQSSGNCVEAAAQAFGFDDDALGDVLPGASGLGLAELRRIAGLCPALAISVVDEDRNEVSPG